MREHSSLDVANQLFARAKAASKELTPMQLIKLTYIAHGWMLGLYGRNLIYDEIQAWQYGPVIPDLYQALKSYRNNPVEEGALPEAREGFDEIETDLLDQVYDKYGNLSGYRLSSMTHQSGTPWDVAWNSYGRSGEISNDLIRTHYAGMAEQAKACSDDG